MAFEQTKKKAFFMPKKLSKEITCTFFGRRVLPGTHWGSLKNGNNLLLPNRLGSFFKHLCFQFIFFAFFLNHGKLV